MSDTLTNASFSSLNLSAGLIHKLTKLGFTVPTPIQAKAIPEALTGRDLIGIAQTGTGKTLAFGLPMISNLRNIQMGLVLAPTRELAIQIEETLNHLSNKTALLIGGAPMSRQISQLRSRPTVVIATPGRLLDHMMQRTIDLQFVGVLVLDEADRMLDMGFAPAIKKIMDATPKTRQTMLFSATMPNEIVDMANNYMRAPARVEIAPAGTVAERIDQQLYVVEKQDKPALLADVLYANRGTVLVFARTRHGAARLARSVRSLGHTAAELHSDRTLAQRKTALNGFKSGEYRVLIATDIAARGIDVKEIELVVNYDVPENPEDYVHRIGRTGRAGATGRAITFATPDQHRDVRDIEKLMKTAIALSPESRLSLPSAPASRAPGNGNRNARPQGGNRPRPQGGGRPHSKGHPDHRGPRPESGPRSEAPRSEPQVPERPRSPWIPKVAPAASNNGSKRSWAGPSGPQSRPGGSRNASSKYRSR